jgi:phage terminase large subunit-like protein
MLQTSEVLNRLTPEFVNSFPPETKAELLTLLEERESVWNETKLSRLYPDRGALRRELYPKHQQFFAAGSSHMERACIAANRVGKTWGIGGYETALHLTGEYPDWWVGRRFDQPIECWAAGDTSETTRDIVQLALFGQLGQLGTGLIPAANIVGEPTKRAGVAGAIDTGRIRHKSGGISYIGLKSYDQGRKKFQGTAKHVIWLDEEPPEDVYDESLLRLMTTKGIMLCTFTPLSGLSRVALRFLPHMAPEV